MRLMKDVFVHVVIAEAGCQQHQKYVYMHYQNYLCLAFLYYSFSWFHILFLLITIIIN